jgi:hypothetical protein
MHSFIEYTEAIDLLICPQLTSFAAAFVLSREFVGDIHAMALLNHLSIFPLLFGRFSLLRDRISYDHVAPN